MNTFNTALANEVLGLVREHEVPGKAGDDMVWSQDVWRAHVGREGQGTFCGTGMCFAGWAVEASPDYWYAIPQEVIKNAGPGSDEFLDPMLVGSKEEVPYSWNFSLRELTGAMRDCIKVAVDEVPGYFIPEHAISLSGAARNALGLAEANDWMGLFDAGNTIADLEHIVSTYAEHGFNATRDMIWAEAVRRFPDWGQGERRADRFVSMSNTAANFGGSWSDHHNSLQAALKRLEPAYLDSLRSEGQDGDPLTKEEGMNE